MVLFLSRCFAPFRDAISTIIFLCVGFLAVILKPLPMEICGLVTFPKIYLRIFCHLNFQNPFITFPPTASFRRITFLENLREENWRKNNSRKLAVESFSIHIDFNYGYI